MPENTPVYAKTLLKARPQGYDSLAMEDDTPTSVYPDSDLRQSGRMIDLEMLAEHADRIYLHRFLDRIRSIRGEMGKYMFLRAGDETAIQAAEDGSWELLDKVTLVEGVPDDTDD